MDLNDFCDPMSGDQGALRKVLVCPGDSMGSSTLEKLIQKDYEE